MSDKETFPVADPVFRLVIELLRLHQQKARVVGSAYQTPLSLVEAYVVIESDVNPNVTQAELCKILNQNKGVVARAIARVVKKGYMQLSWSDSDSRARKFIVTRKGQDFLDFYNKHTRATYSELLNNLTSTEIEELQRYQNLMAEAVGAPEVKIRSVEHPFEVGVRRVTRAFGFAGPSFFGSKYSSTDWQILAAIDRSPSGSRISGLSDLLGIVQSTLSQAIHRFQKNGLISRKTSKQDRRASDLSLTVKGKKILEEIEHCGIEILKRAFADISTAKRLALILQKQLGIRDPGDSDRIIRQQLALEELRTIEERKEARGFLVYNIVRLLRFHDLPERLISSDSRTFAMREGNNLLAVCEIVPLDNAEMRVVNFAYGQHSELNYLLADFFKSLLATLSKDANFAKLHISQDWMPSATLERLAIKKSDGAVFSFDRL